MRSIITRVWEPVYYAYREVATKYGITLSDFMSAVLFYTAILRPEIIEKVLKEEFKVLDTTEAIIDLQVKLREFLRLLSTPSYNEEKETRSND